MYRASLPGQEYTEAEAFSSLLHLSTVLAKFVFNVFFLLLERESRVGDIIFINFFFTIYSFRQGLSFPLASFSLNPLPVFFVFLILHTSLLMTLALSKAASSKKLLLKYSFLADPKT